LLDYEDIERRGEQALIEAIDQGLPEGLTLDYKISHPRNPLFEGNGSLSRKGRELIAEAVSAFANSAGGLLVIGVECKQLDGVDRPTRLVPVSNFARTSSALLGIAAQLVLPRVDGLRFLPIAAKGGEDEGYLIIEIPRSERRPHMSQADRHYYKRSGTSTFPMEHYDIEDAYRRQTAPLLSVRTDLRQGLSIPGMKLVVKVDLLIENNGFSTAKLVTMSLVSQSVPIVVGGPYASSPNEVTRISGKIHITAPPGFAVNPGGVRIFEQLSLEVTKVGDEILVAGVPWGRFGGSLYWELGAENMRPQSGSLELGRTELQPFADRLLQQG
jgi:hypothetical protein